MSHSPPRKQYAIRASWARTLPTLRGAIHGAREYFDASPAARSFERAVIRADGRVTVERFGRRGGRRTVRVLGAVGSRPQPETRS